MAARLLVAYDLLGAPVDEYKQLKWELEALDAVRIQESV
jgi:hypothetical protein